MRPVGLLTLAALPTRQLSNSVFLTAALSPALPGPRHPHRSPAGIHLKAFLLGASRLPPPIALALALGPEHRATETRPRKSRRKIIPQPMEGASHLPFPRCHHKSQHAPFPFRSARCLRTPWGFRERWSSTFKFVGTDGGEARVQRFPKTLQKR